MRTRMKVMGLAALPLAGLLATGGAALAQTAGTPAGTQVVQQAAVHKAGDPCPQHAVKVTARPAAVPTGTRTAQQQVTRTAGQPCPQHAVKTTAQQARDRDRDGNCDHQAARTTAVTVAHSHHDDSCAGHDDHGDR
jgi:hypothetical protein